MRRTEPASQGGEHGVGGGQRVGGQAEGVGDVVAGAGRDDAERGVAAGQGLQRPGARCRRRRARRRRRRRRPPRCDELARTPRPIGACVHLDRGRGAQPVGHRRGEPRAARRRRTPGSRPARCGARRLSVRLSVGVGPAYVVARARRGCRDRVDRRRDVVVEVLGRALGGLARALRRSWTIANSTAPSNSTHHRYGHRAHGERVGARAWRPRRTGRSGRSRAAATCAAASAGSTPARLAMTTSSGSSNAAPNTTSISVTKRDVAVDRQLRPGCRTRPCSMQDVQALGQHERRPAPCRRRTAASRRRRRRACTCARSCAGPGVMKAQIW